MHAKDRINIILSYKWANKLAYKVAGCGTKKGVASWCQERSKIKVIERPVRMIYLLKYCSSPSDIGTQSFFQVDIIENGIRLFLFKHIFQSDQQ